jgi:hypothetical protein
MERRQERRHEGRNEGTMERRNQGMKEGAIKETLVKQERNHQLMLFPSHGMILSISPLPILRVPVHVTYRYTVTYIQMLQSNPAIQMQAR